MLVSPEKKKNPSNYSINTCIILFSYCNSRKAGQIINFLYIIAVICQIGQLISCTKIKVLQLQNLVEAILTMKINGGIMPVNIWNIAT